MHVHDMKQYISGSMPKLYIHKMVAELQKPGVVAPLVCHQLTRQVQYVHLQPLPCILDPSTLNSSMTTNVSNKL